MDCWVLRRPPGTGLDTHREAAGKIRGGSATCDLARLDSQRQDFWGVTRGGRAPGVALDPWLIACAPSGHSVGCVADS